MSLSTFLLGACLWGSARAADAPAAPPPPVAEGMPGMPTDDELPIPTLTLDRIPPRFSYEMALQVSFGEVAYFQEVVDPRPGFGLRGGWGKHFGLHRVGLSGTFAAEGELGINTYLALEPHLTWDFVKAGEKGGIQLGAGAGGAFGYNSTAVTIDGGHDYVAAPSAALRIGWSQGWTRVGRRLFLFLEPKVRFVSDGPQALVGLAFGSGSGR